MAKAPAIGIDFGTTNCCVAVFQNGKVEVIANDEGNRTTPSYVAFTDTGRLIGDAAKKHLAIDPTNTIFDAKGLIGRNIKEPSVQSAMHVDRNHWPFEVVSDGRKPKLQAKYKGQKKTFFPEEIASMVLTKMIETAEAYIGQSVTDAIIAVPAYYNESQRQAIKDAATIAGLSVVGIINEPTAAAIAYAHHKNVECKEQRNIMVFDVGGATSHVSIITVEDHAFKVVSKAEDIHLGGEDFDNRMANIFRQDFERETKKNLTTNKRALERIRIACEQAKIALSVSTEVPVEIRSLVDGIDLKTCITRARFEEMNADLFRRTLEPVKKCLSDAKNLGLDKAEIHDIVLVGGSSRIPKIQKLLRDFFNGKELNTSLNPDEAVAYGAAVKAASINPGDSSQQVPDVFLLDLAPWSLGVETAGGVMAVLIEKNTPIPTEKTRTFRLPAGVIQVYEGERAMTEDNNLLGQIDFTGILPQICGVPSIEVTFEICVDGTLNVTAIEKSTGMKKKITINEKGRLSKEEIEQMVNEAEKYRADEKENDRVSAMNNLKSTVESVLGKCNDIKRWLDANPLAKKEAIEKKQKKLKKVCNPIRTKMNAAGGGAPPPGAAGFSRAGAKRSRLN